MTGPEATPVYLKWLAWQISLYKSVLVTPLDSLSRRSDLFCPSQEVKDRTEVATR